MLDEAPAARTVRHVVKAVSETGLVLAAGGIAYDTPWTAVSSVAAGITPMGDGEMFVLALDIDAGETSRVVTVAESEKVWLELTEMLPVGLPAVEPFARWGAALADKHDVVTLYTRDDPVRSL